MIVKLWHWGIKAFIPYTIPGSIVLVLAKLGAILQNNLFIYAMIATICIILILVDFNKLREEYYYHLIGAIGLALLLQTTLLSPGLVGSDIHTEYYFYYKALDGWNYTLPHPYNSAIGSVILAPALTNILHIPGVWIFKVIFPILLAFVPFLLYFIYKKEFGAKTAFYACIFFVIIPTWTLELTGIPRQMLGELMFTLCLFLILVSKWNTKIRVLLLVIIGILGAMAHYIIGPVIILFLGVGSSILLFFKRRVFPLRWMAPATIIIALSSILYYGTVCQGLPLTCLTTGSSIVQNLVIDWLPDTFRSIRPTVVVPDYPYIEPGTEYENPEETRVVEKSGKIIEIEPDGTPVIPEVEKATITQYITSFSPLIRAAWGADFMEVGIWGKIFRIYQYLTQLSIIIGCIILMKNRKKYSAEYISLCGAAVIILGACMFVPHFSALINATRFYHLSLFMLAPTFIIGGKTIFRNMKMLTICLIIPYFIFTSGLIFEVTQKTDISQIDIPYSISLSNRRVDMVGIFTENDMAVRDWIVANGLGSETYVDTHTQLLLWETSYTFWRDFKLALETHNFVAGNYIFLSERNNKDRAIVLRPKTGGSSSGRRVVYSYDEIGLDKIISEGKILYRQGYAFILEVETWRQ